MQKTVKMNVKQRTVSIIEEIRKILINYVNKAKANEALQEIEMLLYEYLYY